MPESKLAIVVCGWHFKYHELFSDLSKAAEELSGFCISLYIASHKPLTEISGEFAHYAENLGWQLLIFDNEGWDWGAYQQFLRWQEGKGEVSDYYLFLHDDVQIKSSGFLNALMKTTHEGAQVVGNGVPVKPHIQDAHHYPEDVFWGEAHGLRVSHGPWRVVRGSCVFMTRRVADDVLLRMPIKRGEQIELANSSLRLFGALVTTTYGSSAVAYLGQRPRESCFLLEDHRAGAKLSLPRRIANKLPSPVKQVVKRLLMRQRVAPIPFGTGLRVNLGSGKKNLLGYLNVDLHSEIADVKRDIKELEFADESVAEVLMVHTIEHMEINDIMPLFNKIYAWLRSDGQLILEFPDIIKCCRLILENRHNPHLIQTSPVGAQGLYGGNPKNTIHDLHKWGWTNTTIAPLLKSAGFRQVVVERAHYHMPRRDTRVVAIK